jgi:hypothetical protein
MKLAITILAALALVAFNQVFAAAQTRQDFVVKVADRVGTYPPQWPTRPLHRFVYYRSYGSYPVSCEAVIFPRSPLCAGRPASFGPYAPYPWNTFLYN